MKIFLSGSPESLGYAKTSAIKLKNAGQRIVSSWHEGFDEDKTKRIIERYSDINTADALIVLDSSIESSWDCGVGLLKSKKIFLIGPSFNQAPFYYPTFYHFDSFETAFSSYFSLHFGIMGKEALVIAESAMGGLLPKKGAYDNV